MDMGRKCDTAHQVSLSGLLTHLSITGVPTCFHIYSTSTLITLKYMKCIEMSRITSFPSILQHGVKSLVVVSEFECGETGILLSFLGHYVDGRLSVTNARTSHLIPRCWPCTQQRDLTGLDKILAAKSYMELLDKTIICHDHLSIITFA